MKYRRIPFRESHDRANELLELCGIGPDSTIPIDPEVIRRQLGIDVVPYRGLNFRCGLLGGVIKVRKKLQVWIDEDHYLKQPQSSLFTLGEELGHIVLHLEEELDQITSIEDWIKITVATEEYYDYMETQAKTFSTNIILPSFIFDPYTLKWVDRNLKTIKKHNNTTKEELVYNIASDLEGELSVSAYIIEIVLNKRWPNPLIDQIIEKYSGLI